MTKEMKASVVICAFNEESRLSECIQSVGSQDYDPNQYEIIVIDNESTDKTPDIARQWVADLQERLSIRYYRIRHAGLSVARNTGIHHAHGEIIAFLDGDARADPGWLTNLLKPFEGEPAVAIVAGRVENLSEQSAFARLVYRAHFRAGVVVRKSVSAGALTGANMAMRRTVFEVTGGFFDSFQWYGDETSVALSFFETRPDSREAYSQDAIVYNEHPERLGRWLSQRFYQGRMQYLIARHVSQATSLPGLALKAGAKLLGLAFYPALLALPFLQGAAVAFLPLLVSWAAGLISRAAFLRQSFLQVRERSGVFVGTLGPLLVLVGHAFGDAGYVVEALRSLKGGRIELTHSIGEVLASTRSI